MKQRLRRQQPSRPLMEVFLQLCSMTTPHGCEPYCWPLIPRLDGMRRLIDRFNNYHVTIPLPGGGHPRMMWTCHLDTADTHPEVVEFERSGKKNEIISTVTNTILGADDKIGAAIMIKMIEARIPGWYVFFSGEERGRLGSKKLLEEMEKMRAKAKKMHLPSACIAFDRRGYDEVITRQCGQETCSDEFAKALAAILNREPCFDYKPSGRGSFTDSYTFRELIPECTNIAVGYEHQHTSREQQDIQHANMLLKVILDNAAEFEKLPAVRDPNKKEEYGYYGRGFGFNNYAYHDSGTRHGSHSPLYRSHTNISKKARKKLAALEREKSLAFEAWRRANINKQINEDGDDEVRTRFKRLADAAWEKYLAIVKLLDKANYAIFGGAAPANKAAPPTPPANKAGPPYPPANTAASGNDDLMSEAIMAMEKGDLTEKEKEEIELAKRGNARQHGKIVRWWTCERCKLTVKDHGWAQERICAMCGQPMEPKTYRFDADTKLYVPLDGDMTDTYAPHELPDGTEA